MSLIADALKRAQEQRRTGPGDDRARRMLTGSGPLRVELRDGPAMTRPLALAVAALVVAAVVFAGAILLTPEAAPAARQEPAASAAADGDRPGGDPERVATPVGEGAESGGDAGPGDGGTVVDAALAAGVVGEERLSPDAGAAPPPGGAAGRSDGAESGRAESGRAESGRASGSDGGRGERVEASPSSSFRITVRGGHEERTAEQYFVEALGAHRAGDLERAATLYRSALELRPGDAELWNNLGAVYRGLSRPEEALAAFESAVEAEPSYAAGWSNLGLLLEGLGREGDAIEAFREALRQDPNNRGAKVNLANTYQALGMGAEARALLREVLREDPSFPEAHYGLARVLEEEGVLAEAARHYRLFLELGRGRFPVLEQRVSEHLAGLTGGGS